MLELQNLSLFHDKFSCLMLTNVFSVCTSYDNTFSSSSYLTSDISLPLSQIIVYVTQCINPGMGQLRLSVNNTQCLHWIFKSVKMGSGGAEVSVSSIDW